MAQLRSATRMRITVWYRAGRRLFIRGLLLYARGGGFARKLRGPSPRIGTADSLDRSRLHEDDEGHRGGDDEEPRDPQVTVQPATLADHVSSIRGRPVIAKVQDRPSVASAMICTSGGTPVRVKRTTSPTCARSSSLGSLTLKPIVMPAGMKPA